MQDAQERPYKGDVVNGTRRMYLHLYYSVQKAADEELELNVRLDELKSEILTDKRTEKHEGAYEQFFEVTRTPKRGISVKIKE